MIYADVEKLANEKWQQFSQAEESQSYKTGGGADIHQRSLKLEDIPGNLEVLHDQI